MRKVRPISFGKPSTVSAGLSPGCLDHFEIVDDLVSRLNRPNWTWC